MTEAVDEIIDFDEPREKQRAVACVAAQRGKLRLTLCKHRKRRTDRQNRFYWPCFVKPFSEWLTDQYGHEVSPDDAHEILKRTFLSRPLCNADGVPIFLPNGDPVMTVGSTAELDTVNFNGYLDLCAELLWDLFRYTVPEPDVYHEPPEPEPAGSNQ